MKLLIDIGNTSAKLVVSDNGNYLQFERKTGSWNDEFERLCNDYSISCVRISTVAGKDDELAKALEALNLPVKWLDCTVPCPVKEVSNVPDGLGADRWAADIGALSQDSEHTLLVIDAGTCITYDLISREGAILGGAISPGVQLRLKAMHEHTALLPLFEAEETAELIGTDTKSAMMSSAVNGARFEIEGYIRSLKADYEDIHVFMTGGNSFCFPDEMEKIITRDPLLVLKGLDAI